MNNTLLVSMRSLLTCSSVNLMIPRCYSIESVIVDKKVSQEKPTEITTSLRRRDPLIFSRQLKYLPKSIKSRTAWVENLDTVEEQKLGMVDLHPEVWGVMPRIDVIAHNIRWQRLYRFVNYDWAPSRAEKTGGGRKPWPQKGTGRARHGSIRSPLFINGGISHGPRGPMTYFYMLPYYARVLGLTSTLTTKLSQDDLHIVDSLDIPSDEPQYLEDLVKERGWGISVLFVDVTDLMPRNIAVACNGIKHMNLMPAYGLNVFSMLKHETLVLTTAALEHIEEKLLYALHSTDSTSKSAKFRINQV